MNDQVWPSLVFAACALGVIMWATTTLAILIGGLAIAAVLAIGGQ